MVLAYRHERATCCQSPAAEVTLSDSCKIILALVVLALVVALSLWPVLPPGRRWRS